MKLIIKSILAGTFFVLCTTAFMPAEKHFSTIEQQQVSTATKGLFSQRNSFSVDFGNVSPQEYSFPLPIGKAKLISNNSLEITTSKGDAVKAMFEGTVRLSKKLGNYGNVVVIRHENGLETVYANNSQNLVKVGQHVEAGQTVAIVGEKNGRAYCHFSIMVNGGRINPETILEIRSHKLVKQIVICTKSGSHVNVTTSKKGDEERDKDSYNEKEYKKEQRAIASRSQRANVSNKQATSLEPNDEISFGSSTFQINLSDIEKEHWAYPLPGSHVISPYGGARHHAGVDIKTKPNDKILAAFDGVVTRSGPYFGYGNCIVIRHAYGFETLYSHQSRNFVKAGTHVKAGDVIGLTGRTGRATTEHLHFEIHYKGSRLNPGIIFDHKNKSLQQVTLTLNTKGGIKSQRNYYAQGR